MNNQVLQLQQYCNSLVTYSRRKTREVNIGGVPLGGNNPIRIQSMTTIDTMDTQGSVEQVIRMVEAGCEYVRITAPEPANLVVYGTDGRPRLAMTGLTTARPHELAAISLDEEVAR